MPDLFCRPHGLVRACRVPGGLPPFLGYGFPNRPPKKEPWRGWAVPVTAWRHNDAVAEWGTIVANLVISGDKQYRLSGMYFEFQNLANPADTVPVPTFNPDDPDAGINYYNDLATSPDRDYLRVPIISGILQSSNVVLFPAGNQATFFAQSQGVEGVHGKPFSDVNNSKVYGGALVAELDEADATRDLVFSRFYFEDPADQQLKTPTSQIGLEWKPAFV